VCPTSSTTSRFPDFGLGFINLGFDFVNSCVNPL
jgi:hypothetical protein